jgi:hypothetical protein
MTTDKERAKQIIVEIIKQAGGSLQNKTNLFKAFYHAHLEYAKANPDYLSNWPIVRMPRGPGIDNASMLLGELMSDGVLDVKQIQDGDFVGFRFALTGEPPAGSPLSPKAIEAIRKGVEHVDGKTAKEVSDKSHDSSRTWQSSRNGEELNIYLDLPDDDEFKERDQAIRKIAADLGAAW